MTTSDTTFLRAQGWRLMLVTGGVLMAAGGRMHPEADARDPLRQELATMTADERWVPGHTLLMLGTVLFTAALFVVWRGRLWPRGTWLPVRLAAVAFALYTVETVAHLAAAADAHALAHGGAAPIAWTHVGLSIVLYPVSGTALVALAVSAGRAWRGIRRCAAVPGVVAGTLHALSVPLTLVLPDTELSPMFAGAGISLALFSIATGLAGAPRTAVAETRAPVAAVA